MADEIVSAKISSGNLIIKFQNGGSKTVSGICSYNAEIMQFTSDKVIFKDNGNTKCYNLKSSSVSNY